MNFRTTNAGEVTKVERFIQLFLNIKAQIKPLRRLSSEEVLLINDLKDKIENLPAIESSNIKNEVKWKRFRTSLRESILNGDLRNFLNWKVIKDSMFFVPKKEEFNFLKENKNIWDKFEPIISESPIGNPPPYFSFKESSGNLIHQAHHLAKFINKTGLWPEKFDQIIEFGGGYGRMCKLIHDLGFKGKYIIYDLPEFSLLQNYYFKSNNLISDKIGKVELINDLQSLGDTATKGIKTLFIATWSLSESPLEFRDEFLNKISPTDYLIAYQKTFDGIDNIKYFKELSEAKNSVEWHSETVSDNIKDKNIYLFGRQK